MWIPFFHAVDENARKTSKEEAEEDLEQRVLCLESVRVRGVIGGRPESKHVRRPATISDPENEIVEFVGSSLEGSLGHAADEFKNGWHRFGRHRYGNTRRVENR